MDRKLKRRDFMKLSSVAFLGAVAVPSDPPPTPPPTQKPPPAEPTQGARGRTDQGPRGRGHQSPRSAGQR